MTLRSLNSVLRYSNPAVLERFSQKYGVSAREAKAVFRETLKMLWLMELHEREIREAKIDSPKKFMVVAPMAVLDEMWHTFLLFSRDYTEFCEKSFGHYIHHAPTTSKNRKPLQTAEVLNQCHYISDKLGIETLRLWFKVFPKRFSKITG